MKALHTMGPQHSRWRKAEPHCPDREAGTCGHRIIHNSTPKFSQRPKLPCIGPTVFTESRKGYHTLPNPTSPTPRGDADTHFAKANY